MKTFKPESQIAVVFDDHELFAMSFSMVLERSGMFEVVYFFSSQKEFESFLLQNEIKNAWFFLDFLLPEGNSTHLIFDIRRFCPSATIVVVSSLANQVLIKKIITYKINGFIGKSESYAEVISCINQIRKNRSIVHISDKMKSNLLRVQDGRDTVISEFTSRELEVLQLVSEGKSIDEISKELFISQATVVTHRRNMLRKSGVSSFIKLITLLNSRAD